MFPLFIPILGYPYFGTFPFDMDTVKRVIVILIPHVLQQLFIFILFFIFIHFLSNFVKFIVFINSILTNSMSRGTD